MARRASIRFAMALALATGVLWAPPAAAGVTPTPGAAIAQGLDEVVDPLLLDPVSVDFGTVFATMPPAVATVTLTNLGTPPLTIDTVSVSGPDAADASISSETCAGSALAAGNSCTIDLAFSPSAFGTRTASLSITGPEPVGTRTVPLVGSGGDPILVSGAVDFGSVPISLAGTPGIVTLTDYGNQPVAVTSVALGGADAADFAVTDESCTSAPVPVASACVVTIGFTPSALGVRTAELTFTGPFPVGTRTVAVRGTGTMPPSGVAWGSVRGAGPAYTWNGGGALGRTVSSGSQRLHLAYATDRVGGRWATDSGPHAGIYYVRSASGNIWTTPLRLNPTTQHAIRVGLAAAGSRVYVTWVSQTRLIRYSGTAPRVLYVRVNTSYGSSTSWRSTYRITSTTGRVDYPTIAAAGTDAHIAWTDSATGTVRVASSRDRGVTWRSTSLGSTTASGTSGRTGLPSVAVSGSTVVVAWLSNASGTIKARISTNRGVSWATAVTVGGTSIGPASVAVRGTRIAVSWTTADDVVVRQRIAGTWAAPAVIASLTPGGEPAPYAPVVVLQDPNRIAVSWSEETDTADWVNLRWAESADGGHLWFQADTLAAASASSARRGNDWASVLWPSASTRYVVWNGWTAGTNNYRLYLRAGVGSPVGVTVASRPLAAATAGPVHATGETPASAGTPANPGPERGPNR